MQAQAALNFTWWELCWRVWSVRRAKARRRKNLRKKILQKLRNFTKNPSSGNTLSTSPRVLRWDPYTCSNITMIVIFTLFYNNKMAMGWILWFSRTVATWASCGTESSIWRWRWARESRWVSEQVNRWVGDGPVPHRDVLSLDPHWPRPGEGSPHLHWVRPLSLRPLQRLCIRSFERVQV